MSAVTGPTCPSVFCLSYHIEPGATWADGTPVTPDDFRQTVTFQLGPGVQEAEPGYALIDRVETVDENTALVSFSQPYGPWPTLFQRLFRSGHPFQDIREADTTGAFTFADWVEGETVILERDPEWWADRDPLSQTPLGDVRQVSFVFVDDAEEMLAVFNPEGRAVLDRAADSCVYDFPLMNPLAPTTRYTLDGRPIADYLSAEPWASAVKRQELGNTPPSVPMFVGQNAADDLVLVTGVDTMVGKWCAAGVSVDYQRYPIPPVLEKTVVGHGVGLLPAAAQGLEWLDAQFAGGPTGNNCGA